MRLIVTCSTLVSSNNETLLTTTTMIKYINLGKQYNPCGLGGRHNQFAAIKVEGDNYSALSLPNTGKPFLPIGGRRTLKNMVETMKEGESWEWLPMGKL